MPSLSNAPRIPKYRRHKPSGQAVVTLSGRDFYLGRWNTRHSRAEFDRLVAEWMARGRSLPQQQSDLTVTEVAARHLAWAKSYYGNRYQSSGFQDNIKLAVRWLRDVYGHIPANEFGPLALKALRHKIVASGASRTYTNKLVDTIRRIFKWAASEELVSPSIPQGLQTVPGLRLGFTDARETEPIRPVDDRAIAETLPHVSPIVADMVRLQRLTGARPAEICILRPCDVDRSADVWQFVPARHKTQHHGHARVVLIGPLAQAVLLPYLLRDPSAYCFSPSESERKRMERKRDQRRSKVQPSQICRKKARPSRVPSDRYVTDSYRRAIARGCDLAFPPPAGLNESQQKAWRKSHRWAPNRLRHTAATEIRKRYGLEAAQVVLGHASADVSQIYAERDLSTAAAVMREVG